MRPRKPRPGGFGHHVRRYYGRRAGCCRWTGTGARRVTPPRAASQETCHKQPGLKSKSRGLETSVKAAAERREASAAEAGGPCKRMVRGARRARSANGWRQPLAWRGQFSVCAFRRSASPHFIWRRNLCGGETSVAFVLAAKLGRVARTRVCIRPREAGEGDHWSSRSERTWWRGRLRCRSVVVEGGREQLGFCLLVEKPLSEFRICDCPSSSKFRRRLRPLHHPAAQDGPPPPLARGRMREKGTRRAQTQRA